MRRSIYVWAAVLVAAVFAFPLLRLVVRAGGVGPDSALALLGDGGFWRAMGNSLVLASAGAVLSTLISASAGYVLARFAFRGRRLLLLVLLLLASLPGQLLLPGGYDLVLRLGLLDTWWAVLLPGSVSILGVLLYRAVFRGVPDELLDAARIDGCGEWRTWWHVALPVVRPTTSALLCLSFAGAYNAVVWPMVTLQRPELHTLPMRLTVANLLAVTPAEQARVAAMTVLALLPVAGLFLLAQKELSVSLRGAVKG